MSACCLVFGVIGIILKLCFPFNGEMSEWLKEHAWKVCIPLKGIEGSNPSLSAEWAFIFF